MFHLIQLNHFPILNLGQLSLILWSLIHFLSLLRKHIENLLLFVLLYIIFLLPLLFIFKILKPSKNTPLVHILVESYVFVLVPLGCGQRLCIWGWRLLLDVLQRNLSILLLWVLVAVLRRLSILLTGMLSVTLRRLLPINLRWLLLIKDLSGILLLLHSLKLTRCASWILVIVSTRRAHHDFVTRLYQRTLVISGTLIFYTHALSPIRKYCFLLIIKLRLSLVGIFDWRWCLTANMVAPMSKLPLNVPLNSIKRLMSQLVFWDPGDRTLDLGTRLLPISIRQSFNKFHSFLL